MGATGQIFQTSKFPDTLLFVINPRMFWRNLTKIGLTCIPYRFPGKRNPLQTRFCISIAKWSVKEDEKLMSKVAKGKEKTRDKNGKTAKCAEEQDKESTYSFQNWDSRQVFCIQMFLHQGWYLHNERETSFLTFCMVNFWFDDDFFIQNLESPWCYCAVWLHKFGSSVLAFFYSCGEDLFVLRLWTRL